MKWFLNMKIGMKLIIGFILVAIIAGVVGFIGVYNIKILDKSDTELYENMTVPLSQVSEMAKYFQNVRMITRDMIMEDDVERINEKYQSIQDCVAEINTYSELFKNSDLSEEAQAAYDDFQTARAAYRSYLEELSELCLANKDDEAFLFLQADMGSSAAGEQGALEKLVEIKIKEAKEKSDLNTKQANSSILLMITTIIGGMILAILLGIYISRIIGGPIRKVTNAAQRIADGDLNIDIDVHSRDEVGILAESFRKMVENLNEVMSNINEAAAQVASGSKQVSDSSMALSQGATEQASSVEELSSSLEEVSVQTKQNAENANTANQLAEIAKVNALNGDGQMKDMLKAMDEINDSSNSISKIIKVIDDIAFQTNILALNAAVEAARAGQHGKGFAVVAEEVRNLAARSAKAAKETTDMIEGSIKKVEGGTKIANLTADALVQIVDNITKVANLVGNIASASTEQAAAISQINEGVLQVSDVVQMNSATSEESASASEELYSQAEMMKEQVSKFKLRKSSSTFYLNQEQEKLNPEIKKVLDHIGSKKLTPPQRQVITKDTGRKILLNDSEFGKY